MLYSFALLAPLCYLIAASIAASGPLLRPRVSLRIADGLAAVAVGVVLGCGWLLIRSGPGSDSLGAGMFCIGVRVDLVGCIMLMLIAFIGWVVTRFSGVYLDGEDGQGRFTAWMSATISAAMILVLAGSLMVFAAAFVATSLCLHQLLRYYRHRDAATRAARKKFIVSRFADAAMISGLTLLAWGYGTGDISNILAQARDGVAPSGSSFAAGLLAIAAMLKSAQFPTHGWLTEVMETPTPVSALLHAGVVNAGGFLLIRFADVMMLSPLALASLVIVGGVTAMFASVVMLTQSAVKTALAWSTVAQMGFMIVQCGLALFPLALLHIVAHSLYKAYAFLSSSEAVDVVAASQRPGPVAVPSLGAVLRAFGLALLIYGLVGFAFGFLQKPPQVLALGIILIFGIAYLIAQGLADAAPWPLTWRVGTQALAASVAYFALQWIAFELSAGTLPATPDATALEWMLIGLAVLSFGFTAFAQALFPLWAEHPAAAGVRVHLQNGFYVNALFDKLLGNFAKPSADKR